MNEGREFVDIVYGDDGFGAHGFDGGEAGPACDVDWEGVDDRRSEPDGDFESEVVVVASRCGDVKGERVGAGSAAMSSARAVAAAVRSWE
ncbi:hypothetical protein BZL29_7770 [Mycobacterium kansasii]|uniref:Uncharacterized protein n=1 Tax=Mycobacterium kansasii TaxID=1768 RepID=A0A1V3WG33_MYCKA|nr:hypothetical protein BZL29_7770 [Mycobacterium kansasii]